MTEDVDSLGGYVALSHTDAPSGFGWNVDETTSMGRTSTYQTMLDLPWLQDGTKPETEQHINIFSDGLQATSAETTQNGQRSETHTLPDGTSFNDTLAPDLKEAKALLEELAK